MKAGWTIAVLCIFTAQQVQGQGMVGSDFQINSETAGSQYSATITGDETGFVVVWSGSYDDSFGGLTGRRLDADGTPIDMDFAINTVTELFQNSSDVAKGADGRFLVTWTTGELSAGGESNIAARAFDSAGRPLSSDELQVNTFTTGRQSSPAVATAQDGGFVVVWKSPIFGYPNYEIRARRLTPDGEPVGAEFQVNTDTIGRQVYPGVATLEDGNFVVVWHSEPGSYDYDIKGRRLASDGSPVGDDFQINNYTTGFQGFSVVRTAPDGDFLVVWESFGASDDLDRQSVQARLYHSDGSPQGDQMQVNTYTTGPQFRVDVAATDDSQFVVTWIDGSAFDGGQDGDGYGVFARVIGSDGAPTSESFQVNAYSTSSQRIPSVAGAGDSFVVVWQGAGPGVGRNIFGRRLSPGPIFYDDFESGDLSKWSNSEP